MEGSGVKLFEMVDVEGEDSVGTLFIETMSISTESVASNSEQIFAKEKEKERIDARGICCGDSLPAKDEVNLLVNQCKCGALQEEIHQCVENWEGAVAWYSKAKELQGDCKQILTLACNQISNLQTSLQGPNEQLLLKLNSALTMLQTELQLLLNTLSNASVDLDVEVGMMKSSGCIQNKNPCEVTLTTELQILDTLVSTLESLEIQSAEKCGRKQQPQSMTQGNGIMGRTNAQLETQVEEYQAKYANLEASYFEVTKKLEAQMLKNETLCSHQNLSECSVQQISAIVLPGRQTRSMSKASCNSSTTRKRCKSNHCRTGTHTQ
ncbi:unnamed protein product [Allacma fusca]|uniref:Uncharacterized protein n=1 Tax=Allacma fusca TaxID=39272 RepID=A0A8J2L5U2_9HEXA|nr:unnamed protein product [Allacma fusca]